MRLQVRRAQLETIATRLYCVLLVDGAIVGSTSTAALHPHDFCARFDGAMLLQLLQMPREVTLQLWHRRYAGLRDELLSETHLAVPEAASPPSPQWQHYCFSSERAFAAPKPAAAEDDAHDGSSRGSGGREVAQSDQRYLSGHISVAISWAQRPASAAAGGGGANGARAGGSHTLRGGGGGGGGEGRPMGALSGGSLDVPRVRRHVQLEGLDPNAPHDVPLLSLLARAGGAGGEGGAFHPSRLAQQLQWLTSWRQTERTQLLELRRKQPAEWLRLRASERAVPPRDAEIPSAMRELLKPKGYGLGEEGMEEDGASGDKKGISGKVRAWVAQVLAKQQATQSGRSYVLNTRDVVREPLLEMEVQLYNFDTLLHAVEPRRKLLPRRRSRAPTAGSADVQRYVEVVVQSGVDLPVRSGVAEAVGSTKHTVECRFQGRTISTEIKEGATPLTSTP